MDDYTAEAIDKRIQKILEEAGISEPPLSLDKVLNFLDLHRSYYDLTDPNLLQEISHRLKVGTFRIKDIIGKINLRGLWLPDEKKILISQDVPELKKRWVSAHEVGHKIVPWHKDFIFGDTAETLDPNYHEKIEAEANYAASSLLFLASRFSLEAKDYQLSMASVKVLAKKYGNTITMTLRRFTQYAGEVPMVAIISKPHWKVNEEEGDLCRYFIPSMAFKKQFNNVTPELVIDQIKEYSTPKSGGTVGSGEFILLDINSEAHSFVGETFFNRYELLTLIVYAGKVAIQG